MKRDEQPNASVVSPETENVVCGLLRYLNELNNAFCTESERLALELIGRCYKYCGLYEDARKSLEEMKRNAEALEIENKRLKQKNDKDEDEKKELNERCHAFEKEIALLRARCNNLSPKPFLAPLAEADEDAEDDEELENRTYVVSPLSTPGKTYTVVTPLSTPGRTYTVDSACTSSSRAGAYTVNSSCNSASPLAPQTFNSTPRSTSGRTANSSSPAPPSDEVSTFNTISGRTYTVNSSSPAHPRSPDLRTFQSEDVFGSTPGRTIDIVTPLSTPGRTYTVHSTCTSSSRAGAYTVNSSCNSSPRAAFITKSPTTPRAGVASRNSFSPIAAQNYEFTDASASSANSSVHSTPKRRRSVLRRSVSAPLMDKSRDGTPGTKDDNNPSHRSVLRTMSASDRNPSEESLVVSPTVSVFSSISLYDSRVERRQHVFIIKRNFKNMNCCVCTGSIRFAVEYGKCSDCRMVCHQHCRIRMNVPCVPWKATIRSDKGRLRLGDFCADTKPKLPHHIIYCVRYLNTVPTTPGIYTDTSFEEESTKLMNQLDTQKGSPNFTNIGPIVAAHCIIKFLLGLRESLIPFSSNTEFLSAIKCEDNRELMSAIDDLPIVHKNTLSYLMLHWQFVSDHSEANGLSDDILAHALIPVVMRIPADDIHKYEPIFIRLLNIEADYWVKLIEEDCVVTSKTPLSRSSSKKERLEASCYYTVQKLTK